MQDDVDPSTQASNFNLPSSATCLGRLLLPTIESLYMVKPYIRSLDKLPSEPDSIFCYITESELSAMPFPRASLIGLLSYHP
jgi:hypothetical protein